MLSLIEDNKDKPNAEGVVGNISTWITAALRNEQFFSLSELKVRQHFFGQFVKLLHLFPSFAIAPDTGSD